jgi:sporulation-control protein spo0M
MKLFLFFPVDLKTRHAILPCYMMLCFCLQVEHSNEGVCQYSVMSPLCLNFAPRGARLKHDKITKRDCRIIVFSLSVPRSESTTIGHIVVFIVFSTGVSWSAGGKVRISDWSKFIC